MSREQKKPKLTRFLLSPRLIPSSSPRLLASSPLRIFFVFTLWAISLTYPLPLHLFSHIPLGSEEAATVPFFNLWTLQWNIDQLGQGYPRYWNAPIFAPDKGTFAFSEPQLLSALLAAPLWLSSQSPAFGYNALVILFLTLNGWFAYWLLRSWKLPTLPALLAGLLMQSLPFIAQEMGVLQLIAIFGFLWSLLFLNRFLAQSLSLRPSPSPPPRLIASSLALAFGTPVTFLTCGYYGLFSLFFLPLAFVFHLRREHLQPKVIGQLSAIGLLALALTVPVLWVQEQQLTSYHFTRSVQTIENNSAKLEYYGGFLDGNLFYGQILGLKTKLGQRLFPGFALMSLAILGLFGRQQKKVKLYCLVAVVLALLLSLGLRLDLAGWRPYEEIRQNVPGFAQLRSPFRFAVFVQVHLALLAGFGLHNLGIWFPPFSASHPGGDGNRVLALAAALALFEALALPLPLLAVPDLTSPLPWQAWLNEQNVDNSGVNIVMLPFAPSNKVEDFEQTTRWMLTNRHLQGDILNGYSGFFPTDHAHVRELMLEFPSQAGLELLRKKGIDYVVVTYRASHPVGDRASHPVGDGLANVPKLELIDKYLARVYQDEREGIVIYALSR